MNRNRYIAFCAVLLLAAVLLPLLVTPAAASDGYTADLSRPSSVHTSTLGPAELVEYFGGEGVSDAERAYLEKHGGVSIKLDLGITTSYLVSEYHDGTLTVIAREYSYTATDGTAVTWLPDSVTCGGFGAAFDLTDVGYVAVIEGLTRDDSLVATVLYKLDVTVPTEVVNRLLNLAYNDVPAIRESIEAGRAEYDRLKAEYDAGVIAYEEYLAALSKYEADHAAYTDYLSKKQIYEDARAEYDAYLKALAEYDAAVRAEAEYKLAVEEYNAALVAYTEYVQKLDVYNAKLAEYNVYLEKIERVRSQLDAVDLFQTPMTDDRTAYYAIFSTLVSEVLENNRDLFESATFKVDACLIDDASAATAELRELLRAYFKLESEVECYQFYINNYEALRDNTTLLLQALDELYNYDKVRAGINYKNPTYPKKYEILVAQLAILANLLTDGPVYSYWAAYHDTKCTSDCTLKAHANNRYVITESTLIHKTSVLDVLEGVHYLDDTDSAAPLTDGIPLEVARPEAPTVVEKPVKPVAPTVPAKPNAVDDPGAAPTPVTEPTLPDKVTLPEPPKAYIPPEVELAVLELYDAGGLKRREEKSGECIYTATQSVEKRVFVTDTVSVFFYDTDGTLLFGTEVDRGTRADYIGIIPTKEEDEANTYAFSHWINDKGEPVSLSAVETDLSLYPAFAPTVKHYDVTFTVNGESVTQSLAYGATPTFDGIPTRPDDEYREYTFSGWDKEITPVSGNAEYTATFSSVYILPLTNGGARVYDNGSYIVAECADPFTYTFDLSGLIARATDGKTRGILLDTRIFDLTLSYQTVLKMRDAGDTAVTLSRRQNGSYTFYYSAKIGEGDYRFSAVLPCTFPEGRQLRLYYLDGEGNKNAVLYDYVSDSVKLNMTAGVEYTLAEEYELGVIEGSVGNISISGGTVARGEKVTVEVEVPPGVVLERVYLIFPDGSELDVTGKEFVMPDSDVTVCTVTREIEYLITFVSVDKTLVVYKHRYGDTVTPPPDPTRPSDGTYRYQFVGWSQSIGIVTSDMTYYAQFESIPIPPKEEPSGLQISDSVLGLLVAGGAFVGMMALAVLPATVVAIILTAREKRRYLKRRKNNTGRG